MANHGHSGRWLTIVGIGEDGVAGLSPAAAERLAQATFVFGGRRHLDLARPLLRGESRCWASPIENTFPALLARRGLPTCVLASGDPFHFGIGATLARFISSGEIQSLPQPSAFSMAAALLGWTLQDCACVSLHGRALERIVPLLQPRRRVLVLAWDRTTPQQLATLLHERGFGASRLIVCERMGGPGERSRPAMATSFDLDDVADLNTIAIEVEASPGAKVRPFAPGLPDAWFEHDGQITKAPVRAITLSALMPRFDELMWDIGAGSGSVSIEWLLSDPSTRAIAIERRSDRRERVARNAAVWGVRERLTLVEGDAPGALEALPPPDAVFIGGGVTGPDILNRCRAALTSGGRLVVNAVTTESQQVLLNAHRMFGGDLLTLGIATAEPIGSFHGLRPAMTVMQWRWTRS